MSVYAITAKVRVLLWTFALFELYHAISHAAHYLAHRHVIHAIWYAMVLASWVAIHGLAGLAWVPYLPGVLIGSAVALDVAMYAYTHGDGIGTILTGLLVLSAVVFGHWAYLPALVRHGVLMISLGMVVLFLMIVNEQRNCERMQRRKRFPYHVLIEVVGLVLFVALASVFLRWDRSYSIY